MVKSFLLSEIRSEVLYLTLNNPTSHNALNPVLIGEIEKAFLAAKKNKKIKLICLKASGKNFCAGADLKWMAAAAKLTETQNIRDMQRLAKMYKAILAFDRPLIIQVQGKALGGGVGLVATGDLVICENNSSFTMPETRIGLIPGIITPIVMRKIGLAAFTHYALTGESISADEALKLNLVTKLVKDSDLNQKTQELIESVLKNSTEALIKTKELVNQLHPITEKTLNGFARESAKRRKSLKLKV